MKYLKANPVEDYLRENKGKKISVKKMKYELGLKTTTLVFFANNSKNIRNVYPLEVGSNRAKMNVYSYQE